MHAAGRRQRVDDLRSEYWPHGHYEVLVGEAELQPRALHMRRLLSAFVAGLAVATVVWFGVGVLTTWTVIHSGRSEFAIRSYFVGVGIASLALGILAGSWWYRWPRKRGVRGSH